MISLDERRGEEERAREREKEREGERQRENDGEQPAPMNHVKIFQGWPPQDASSKLVQLWYKTFPPDQRGLVEMNTPTRLGNKTSTA